MIISNCPRCQEGFRVPLGTMPDDAYAMCPWCHETFPLAEVLNHLPPPLQILTADGEPIAVMEPVANPAAAGIQSLTGTAAGALDDLQANDGLASGQQWDPTALNFGADSGQTDGAWDAAASPQAAQMSVSPRPNRRKKGGSGIRTMIQVVVGGLLAVPIALLILLAFGRALDLGFWPFDGQARSPRELFQFLDNTPTQDNTAFPKYGGQQLDTTSFDEAEKDTEDPAKSALDQIFAPDVSPDSDDQSNLDVNTSANPEKIASTRAAEARSDPLQSEQDAMPPELPISVANENLDSAPVELPESATSKTTDKSAGTPTTVIAASQTKPSAQSSEADTVSKPDESIPAQVMVEVTAAIQAIEILDTANQSSDTDRLAEAYEGIAEACETAQKYPTALTTLAKSISQSKALNQIEEAAGTWLDYPQRSTQGIVLIGKPGTTAKSQILTLDSGRVLTMTGNLNLPLAEKVMVLGQITRDDNVIEISFTAPIP